MLPNHWKEPLDPPLDSHFVVVVVPGYSHAQANLLKVTVTSVYP